MTQKNMTKAGKMDKQIADIMLTTGKRYEQASVFKPENLLREARRQRVIEEGNIPAICLLDPDGDIVRYLIRSGRANKHKHWACYHTNMYVFNLDGNEVGIIGCAVGAPFAVLLAEQMFVSGCELLISITSAGILNPPPQGTKFLLIESALRDEGTSFHYLAPGKVPSLPRLLLESLRELTSLPDLAVSLGTSWTTDAPYRETEAAISYARAQGALAVEMEASALYAFAEARQKDVVCFAHLTNNMAKDGDDFEKGVENGSVDSIELVRQTIQRLCRNDSTRLA
ncbi:MAG: nucleoside phosphorylase [Saprospiraceae bacterium]|nr:nucleoside phosphorylase [Saprospiraceae bacterium]